jgi:hypothetical protein
VDPNSARAALRLDPALPLTPDLVEHAFQQELWARHPSRYPDAEGRAAAEAWAATLATARSTLLAEAAGPAAAPAWTPPATATAIPTTAQAPSTAPSPAPSPTPAASAPQASRRRSTGWIITASAVGAALFVAAGFGLFFGLQSISERVADQLRLAEAQARLAESQAVDRYAASEMAFTFPAALEIYSDGRLWEECGDEYAQGCWQMAVFPTQGCDRMQVVIGYQTDEYDYEPEVIETIDFGAVEADEPANVVFGNDDFPYGWVEDVICLDATGA